MSHVSGLRIKFSIKEKLPLAQKMSQHTWAGLWCGVQQVRLMSAPNVSRLPLGGSAETFPILTKRSIIVRNHNAVGLNCILELHRLELDGTHRIRITLLPIWLLLKLLRAMSPLKWLWDNGANQNSLIGIPDPLGRSGCLRICIKRYRKHNLKSR